MAKIKFTGYWSKAIQKLCKIPKGFLLISYEPVYRQSIGKYFMKLDEMQEKKMHKLHEEGKPISDEAILRQLDIEISYHYRKRTIDQNALLWSLYTIEANEMNGGQSGHKNQVVTPEELYQADLDEWGERETITTRRKNLGYYIDKYSVLEAITLDNGKEIAFSEFMQNVAKTINGEDMITLRVIRSSSMFNTKEMANWIDRIFNRLAYNGVQVTDPGEIQNYWLKWREHINDNKITLHDYVMTQEEYKALNPICEACSAPVMHGKGHLSHIQAIGMGGDRTKEPSRNYASNWLHLCAECHLGVWHNKGVKSFLKQFKHLTYKVNTALSREYKEIPEIDAG